MKSFRQFLAELFETKPTTRGRHPDRVLPYNDFDDKDFNDEYNTVRYHNPKLELHTTFYTDMESDKTEMAFSTLHGDGPPGTHILKKMLFYLLTNNENWDLNK